MDVKVTYYRLGPNGMPNSPEQYETVQIEPSPNEEKEKLVQKALSEKTFISEDKFKVIEITES